MDKTTTVVLITAGVVTAGALAAIGTRAATHAARPGAPTVVIGTVQMGSSDNGVMAEGTVIPGASVNVSVTPGAQGRIMRLFANVGDYVEKGQLLAELDTTDHVDDYRAAAAEVRSKAEDLKLVQNPYRPEEIDAKRLALDSDRVSVEVAKSRLKLLTEGARTQEVAQAKSALKSAQAQLQLVTDQADRDKQLFDKELIPRADMEQSSTAVIEAQNRVDTASAKLSLITEGPRQEEVRQAELEMEKAQLTLQQDTKQFSLMLKGARSEAVQKAVADYQGVVSKAHKQSLLLGYHEVRAPISGVVVARNVSEGEYATADNSRTVSGQPLNVNGKSLFVISDNSKAQFYANVDQRFYKTVRPGMTVQIGLEAFPGVTFPGHIQQVTPLVQPSTVKPAATSIDLSAPLTFGVRATFDIPQKTAVAGQAGMLTLANKQRDLVVPQSAITAYSVGQGVAYVVEGGIAHSKSVHYDPASDGNLHVTKGLSPGEQVIISDPTSVHDGMAVNAVTATADNFNQKAM